MPRGSPDSSGAVRGDLPVGLLAYALGLTALYLGVASAARDWLIGFLSERTPAALGRPLATRPRFQSAVSIIAAAGKSALAAAPGNIP